MPDDSDHRARPTEGVGSAGELSSLEGVLEVQSRIGPLDADLRLRRPTLVRRGGAAFAAIPGARFDDHDFIPAALERLAGGASRALA